MSMGYTYQERAVIPGDNEERMLAELRSTRGGKESIWMWEYVSSWKFIGIEIENIYK